MGGSSQNRSPKVAGGGRARQAGDTPSGSGLVGGVGVAGSGCDIHLEVDLAGVRSDVISALSLGDVLDVVLRAIEGYEAVACLDRPGGRIAGTLANVEGLDRMIGCLRTGHRYLAVVTELGSLRCRVQVDPVQP